MLGLVRIRCARVCGAGAVLEGVYGCAGKLALLSFPDYLLMLGTVEKRPKNQKKNNINYHLSRLYPKIIGPHKRK